MQILLKNTLKLPKAWLKKWKSQKISDPFERIVNLKGKIFRQQPGRKTLRFFENGKPYFVKIHTGFSLKEIFKNLFKLQLPIMGAANEIKAILHLEKYSFVPKLIGYGFRTLPIKNLNLVSFIITGALEPTISLEDFCKNWPLQRAPLKLKWALIRRTAEIAKITHENGLNHRDFYLCHFLLDLLSLNNLDNLNIFVIDWHRAQIRRKTPLRWRIKDIAGLYFSAMNIGLTQTDLYRFIKIYNYKNKNFWRNVKNRGIKLYRKI